MTRARAKLVFVYNADASPLAQAFDFLHKLIAPATYACNLCRVTHGAFAPKREWIAFVKGLPYPAVFLHRDEFRRRYPALRATPLPAIFGEKEDAGLGLLASAEELNRLQTLSEMKTLMASKLS